jgi:hypothetical protein
MKNYTSLSLSSSPNTNYTRFNDNGGAAGGGGLGGLGGLADNLAFKRLEKYDSHGTYMTHEAQQKREINRNSDDVNKYHNLYTTENIIQIGDSNGRGNEPFVAGEVVYRTIIIPFYVCLMDIIIFNDLYIEVVDNGNVETKNKILISGKIRKYRLNGVIKNYDIFIEMENENVFHVKKRGIMMRVRVNEELRQLILNTMVNYVADGKDLDPKPKAGSSGGGGGSGLSPLDNWENLGGGSGSSVGGSVGGSSGGSGSVGGRGRRGNRGGGGGPFACFGCFKP